MSELCLGFQQFDGRFSVLSIFLIDSDTSTGASPASSASALFILQETYSHVTKDLTIIILPGIYFQELSIRSSQYSLLASQNLYQNTLDGPV